MKKTEFAKPPEFPADARPAPFALNKIKYAIPTGADTLSKSPRIFMGGLLCQWPFGTFQSGMDGDTLPSPALKRLFGQTMDGLGYDVAGDPGRMFDEREDLMRAQYAIGGKITDMKIDICDKAPLFTFTAGTGSVGEAHIEIEWNVYDFLHRKNMMKYTTKGYAKISRTNQEAIPLLVQNAFAMAAHNLGANPEFRDLMFYGVKPPETLHLIENPDEDYPVMKFDTREDILLPALAVSSASAKGRFEQITKNTVLIESAGGHGSGFFITKQGHLMTNAHVIGFAQRVPITTSGKKDRLIAEVLRVDRQRDVALLRLETLPDNLDIQLHPLRTDKPDVGDTIYVIGTPHYKRLQDTLTSGIISAHRFDRKLRTPFIQSDADIHGGNSGGPMYDEFGNIIGISVRGYINSPGSDLSGLNEFIPIASALDFLDIKPPMQAQ